MTDGIVEWVDGADDPRLDDYRGLKGRPAKGTGGPVIVESLLGVEALATSGLPIRSVLVSPQKLDRLPVLPEGTTVLVADLDVQRATVGFELHRGVVASAERPAALEPAAILAGARRVVVAERINDLENLGSLFRNARAFGADAVLLDPETADPLGRRPVRVSMGHVLHVPFARLDPWPDALDLVRGAGLTVVALASLASLATEGADGEPMSASWRDDLPERAAILVGAEGPGLTDRAVAAADQCLWIPMASGVDSINVATAAAITLSAHAERWPRR